MTPCCLLLWAALATGAGASAEARISSVTVYSDQARVVRTASVPVSGSTRLELPLLRESVDPASIRVEARGAEGARVEVARVEVARVEAGEASFPMDEARKLLAELEKVDDRLALATQQREAWVAEASTLSQALPAQRAQKERPPPPLTGKGWAEALGFLPARVAQAQARVAALNEELERLQRQREALVDKARLLGGARREGGWRVTATLEGKGTAEVTLTYLARGARWSPAYDLQYLPAEGKVVVSFGGLVSQETGEDWEDAALTLSTALPHRFMPMPRLLTWKLGEKERFIPTPVAQPRPLPPSPPAAVPSPGEVDELERLRSRLLEAAGDSPAQAQQRELERRRQELSRKAVTRAPPPPPPPPPSPRPSRRAAPSAPAAFEAAPSAAMPEPDMGMVEANDDFGALPSESFSESIEVAAVPSSMRASRQASVPMQGVGLAPPPGYRRPVYAPDLPVSLAGGHDLFYSAPRRETVASGQGTRRVALFARTWPVKVERLLYPAIASEAWLVAELENPSKEPLPGGQAHLFVGEDPAGVARLELISPGERFTLPLGLDRALQPVRNVALVQSEQGLLGQTELSEYSVTIELANPYPHEVPVRVFDQVPVTSDPDLEVKLLETKPQATPDPVKGTLEWRLSLPASGKTTLSFRYSLRRPKGYRLHQ